MIKLVFGEKDGSYDKICYLLDYIERGAAEHEGERSKKREEKELIKSKNKKSNNDVSSNDGVGKTTFIKGE